MNTEQQHNQKKIAMMEKCFDCYAEHGLTGTGVKMLAQACGCSPGNLYAYFKNRDELILESTAYCMARVEEDFMKKAPADPKDVVRFIEEVPYWTAKKHGKKYRLMYQVYTLPQYMEYGKKFFEGGQRAVHCLCQAAGAEARDPLYHDHPADLRFRPGVCPLRHV